MSDHEVDEDFEREFEDAADQADPLSGPAEEEDLPESEPVAPKAKPEGRHTVLPHERRQQKPEPEARKWNEAPEGGGKYALSPDGRRVRVESPTRPQEPIKG